MSLLDDVDQFLTEVVNQRWSKNQLSDFQPIDVQQTIFPRSSIEPLALPQLDHWATKLRQQLRKIIKDGSYQLIDIKRSHFEKTSEKHVEENAQQCS